MALWKDLVGTTQTFFRLGLSGVRLKNNGGHLDVRNAGDTAYAEVRALLARIYGNNIELNSGAAGSGADYKMTLSRPAAGMSGDVQIVLPATLAPTVGQALSIASVAGGVITLGYANVPTGTDQSRVDTTSLAFDSASPVAMFNLPAGAVVRMVRVIIDTAFNGAPTLSIGITGTLSKYMPTSAVDLTAAAGSVFEYTPTNLPAGVIEALIATYAAGGATAGAARIEVDWAIPS